MQPPSFLSRQKTHCEPYMYIEVNMGAGKIGRIGVYQGADPSELAANFCMIYGLGSNVQDDIESLIAEQIAS